jgi:hypothetical protein
MAALTSSACAGEQKHCIPKQNNDAATNLNDALSIAMPPVSNSALSFPVIVQRPRR